MNFPIYSTISPITNNKFLISLFLRNKDYMLQDNTGKTFFYKTSADTSEALNFDISKQFEAEYIRGTFDQCLAKLGFDHDTDELVVKNNNFRVLQNIRVKNLNPLTELIFSN